MICLPQLPSQSTESPVPIGYLTLSRVSSDSRIHRRSNIGINIAAAHRSKGYGGEAIDWALDWGFRRAGLHRIGLGYVGWNAGAGRLYERLGFVNEGVRRDFFWGDGRWWDSVEMSILEGEWRERNVGANSWE
jgi:RimJ/RimL family protein N-acetyltransferase